MARGNFILKSSGKSGELVLRRLVVKLQKFIFIIFQDKGQQKDEG